MFNSFIEANYKDTLNRQICESFGALIAALAVR